MRLTKRTRRREERGGVAVEFVLVVGILLALTFGIMDFAVYLRDTTAASNAVRDAARTASALPRFGVSPAINPTFGHDGNDGGSFASRASDVFDTTGGAIPQRSIDELWIYKANADGFPGDYSDFTECPANSCVRYRWWDGPTGDNPGFQYAGGLWDPLSITACPGDADTVGVYLRVDHQPLIGWFSTDGAITDSVVARFEPRRDGPGTCRPAGATP